MRSQLAPHDRLISGLRVVGNLSADEDGVLRNVPLRTQAISSHQDVVREGARPNECCLVVDGFFCSHRLIGDGQRQIISFHLPGDIPDLQTLMIERSDCSVGALAPSQVAFISHAALRDAMEEAPSLRDRFWRATLLDAARSRDWISSLGRRPAYERTAHLMCELFTRMRALGLAEDGGFALPLTQVELADALGLSPVHINRTLQQLRHEGTITFNGKYLGFANWERLQMAGDFESAYLGELPPQKTSGHLGTSLSRSSSRLESRSVCQARDT